MNTASPSLASARALARVLFAVGVVALGLAAAVLLQPTQTEAADPIYACYSRSDYSLRSVTGPDKCKSTEREIVLNNNAHPIWVCLHPSSGKLRYAGNAELPITSRCLGASPSQFLQIPGDNDTTLCVTTATGAMTLPPCGTGQTPLVIPKRNTAPVAQNKTATVPEDGSVVVQLSASDADGQSLTFAITQPPTNGGLSAITGTSCTGTVPKTCTANVTYTPNANYFGPDTFKYKANDGLSDSNLATVSVTVDPINDAPSFTSGGDVTVNEDSGAYNQAWATNVTAGPNENSVQTVTFTVTGNDNTALFSAGPAVSSTGALSFTPAADTNGEANITVKISDNGGTAGGGVDQGNSASFKITVRAVNDRPTIVIEGSQTVAEDAGSQTVANFAHDFDAGPPDEDATQSVLDYKVSTDEDELFSVQPDISNGGTLTYTPAPNASGAATIRVRVQDDGGTDFGGQDTSDQHTFVINISAVNDAPVVNLADSTVSTLEDTDLVFSTANGNLVSITDVDAGSGAIKVTLTVTHGGITLDSTSGLTFTPPANGANDVTMTFTGTLADVNGALSDMTYLPDADYFGSDTLSIAVDDQGNTGSGGAQTDSDTVAITVDPVNDPPDFTSAGGVTVDEDSGPSSTTWATGITLGPANETGQSPTFTLSNNDNTGLFSSQPAIDSSGTLTFTPAANKNGVAHIEVVLSDGGGTANGGDETSATKILTITVNAVNDEPSFSLPGSPNQSVAEDSGPHTVNGFASSISKGPTDENGQTLTFHVSNDNNPLFSTQPDIDETTGNLTYTPAANANGVATVSVYLTDDGSNVAPNDNTSPTQTFTITVTAVNDAPVLTVPSSIAVDEDVAKPLTGISFTDIDAANNTAELTLSVPSGQGTFTAGPFSSFTVNGSGTNTITVIAAVSTINAYINGGISFTTALNATADVTMTVTVDDHGFTGADPGLTGTATSEADTETVTLDVTAVNDAPVFTSGGNVSIPPGTSTYSASWATGIGPGGGANESGQTVHFEITGNTNPALFESTGQPAISSTGQLTFTAVTGADGSSDITVVLKDNGGTSPGVDTSAPVTFTISTNEPPTISDVTDQTIIEDTTTGTLTVTVGDPDEGPDALILSASSDNPTLLPEPASYVFGGSGANRTVTITPAANQNGTALVTLTVTDSGGETATDTFTLTVTAVNDEPTFTLGANQTVNEDAGPQTVNGFATAISAGPADESGQTLTFTVTNDNNPLFSTQPDIDETIGTLTYTPAANANGSTTVSVVLTDNGSNVAPNDNTSVTKTFTITINAVNDAPSFTSGGNVTVGEDSGAYNQAWATGISKGGGSDENGQTLTFNVTGNTNTALFSTQPAVNSSTGNLSFTPATNANGSAQIMLTLSDNGSNTPPNANTSAPVTFTITVTPVNDKPVLIGLESTTITYTENDPATQLTNAIDVTDVDGTTLTQATVTIGSYASGQDVLAFTLQPGITGNFDTGTGVLTFTASPAVAHATFETVLRSVTYQNTSDDPTGGNRVISFQVNDGQAVNNLSDAVTRTVNVVPVNDPPVITGEPYSFSIDENSANGTNVGTPITYTDAEAAQTRTFSITGGNSLGAFAIGASTGQITVADTTDLNFEVNPTFSLTVQVQDNGTGNLTDTTTVTINLNNVNEAPTANADSYNAFGNTQLRINTPTSPASAVAFTTSGTSPLTNDTDPDTAGSGFATLQITAAGSCNKGGTLVLNAADHSAGRLVYLPAAGINNSDAPAGNETCSYTLSDGTNNVSGNLSFNVTQMVWYVQNTATSPGDTGTSQAPFNTLAEAGTASSASEIIYVLTGDGTATGQNTGISLKNGQKLWGQGVPLVVSSTTLITAGTKAVISNSGGNGVTVDASSASLTGVEIRGLSISGNTNAIDVTAGGANNAGVTISDNAITAAGVEGIDVNAGSTGTTTVDVQNNTIASTGNGFDAATSAAGSLVVTFSTNSNITSGATGVNINGSGGGTTTVRGFADNVVTGNTGGTGISVTSATFDSAATAGIQQVSGGNTVVGASGNGVGGSGVVLTNVQGDLLFADLDVVADNGSGLQASGTGGGFTLGVNAGVGTITTTGGPAISLNTVAANIQTVGVTVNSSPTSGISLATVTGTVSTTSGSSITSATGTDVSISGSSAIVSYAGSITNTAGNAVVVQNHTTNTVTFGGAITTTGGAGGISLSGNSNTINFTGTLNLSTGTNNAFSATNSSLQGIVSVDPVSTNNNVLTTTSGTALTITNTTISANGLEFKSISAGTSGTPVNGILLNNTGTSGGLTVFGGGSTAQGGDNSGGTIQNTSSFGISLTSTANPSFNNMNIQNTDDSGISGTQVTNFTFTNGTINGAGNGSNEGSISLNTSLVNSNVSGTVTVTNSELTGSDASGVNIQNGTGTVSNATISDNLMSGDGPGTFTGAAVKLVGLTATANLTRATLSNNTITAFDEAAFVVQANGGNIGIAGDATNKITVTGNFFDGGNGGINFQPDRFITAGAGGGGTGGQGNLDVSSNGSAASPIRHIDCIAIEITADGSSNVTTTINNNFIEANSAVGCAGIAPGADNTASITATINNNNISDTDGQGIFSNIRNGATGNITIKNNIVAAPTVDGVRSGIQVSSGSSGTSDATVCVDIQNNTTAGSTSSGTGSTSPGIALRKESEAGSTDVFGVEGMSATASPGVEQYVGNFAGPPAGKNPNSANGTFGNFGVTLLAMQTGFSNCSSAP